MSILKNKKIKSMDRKELVEKMKEFRKELISIRGKISSKTNPESPGRIKELRKTIARIKTTLRLRGES